MIKKLCAIASVIVVMTIVLSCDYVTLDIFNKVASIVSVSWITGKGLMLLAFYISLLFYFCTIQKKKISIQSRMVYVFISVFVFILIVTCMVNWDSLQATINIYYIFDIVFLFIPVFLFIFCCEDYQIILDYLWVSALVLFAFGMYVILKYELSIQQGYKTSMPLGFVFSMVTLVFCEKMQQKECACYIKIIGIIVVPISSYVVIMHGNRGSFVILACYLMFVFWQRIKKNKYLLGGLVFFAFSIFLFFDKIVNLATEIAQTTGISSRTLAWIFMQDANLGSSGRITLWKTALNKIKDSPFVGYGPFGDYKFFDGYVHNLFLELILDYGCILGVIFVLFIMIGSFMAVSDKKTKNIASVFVVYTLVELMFSGSYLIDCYFWVMLGIIFRAIFEKRLNKKKSLHVISTNEIETL